MHIKIKCRNCEEQLLNITITENPTPNPLEEPKKEEYFLPDSVCPQSSLTKHFPYLIVEYS